MSANKFKYYEVVTTETRTVRANSKRDALKLANGARNVKGSVLGETSDVEATRISANQAHTEASSLS